MEKPQPGSPDVKVFVFLHAVKTLGQPGQVFGADFGAFVIDGNSNGFACRHFVAFGKGDGRSLADARF